MANIRSKAGHVLATSEDPEARSLAAYVLSDDAPVQTTKTKADLQRILSKIEGQEGQTERASLIRRQIEAMG